MVIIFAAAIIVVVAAANVLILWWWFTPPKFVVEADAGFKKAKTTIDREKLRAWALTTIEKYRSTNNEDIITDIPNSEIPNYIQNLYALRPESAFITRTGDNQSYVAIMWGGGFFHWGLEVGNTNFSLPLNSNNPEYPFDFEWIPGIYYTREAKWKLQ
jgi:hypothetical protein